MNKSSIAAALGFAVVATAAWAATPAETITARQANFKQLGGAQRAINEELRKPSPDLQVIRTNADILAQSAGRVPDAFPAGAGPESGATTKALPVIWQQQAQFSEAAGRLVTAAENLKRAAAGDDIEQIRTALPNVGSSCRGCHDTFRA